MNTTLGNAERRKENATAARLMANIIHKGRQVSADRAQRLAEKALRRYPMARYPDRRERIPRMIEWIFSQTKPRKGLRMAADK